MNRVVLNSVGAPVFKMDGGEETPEVVYPKTGAAAGGRLGYTAAWKVCHAFVATARLVRAYPLCAGWGQDDHSGVSTEHQITQRFL